MVDIERDSYISLGFGQGMTNVDMMAWRSEADIAVAEDYWSTSYGAPKLDDVQSLSTPSIVPNADGSRVTFTTTRLLDTGEYSEDFLVPLNTEIDLVWAIKTSTGAWVYHDARNNFRATFTETLGNPPAKVVP